MGLTILQVINSGGLYGAEAVVLALMEQLARLGHRPVLGSMAPPGAGEKPLETEAHSRSLAVRRINMGTLPSPRSLCGLCRMVRDEQADLVHCHGYKPDIVFGYLSKVRKQVPVIATLHGWCGTKGLSKLRIYDWLDAQALSRFDGVAVVSASMLRRPSLADRRLPQLRVIANAVPRVAMAPSEAADQDPLQAFCRQGFTFGSVGRLSAEKDFVTLLEAFALVRKSHDARLVIMGEGAERQALTLHIDRLALGPSVLLPGFVPRPQRYLPLLGAYVLSSTSEGMPISILEAMAAGLPIVSTAVGEVPRMLEDGRAGLLVPPVDRGALAGAMERLFVEADLRRELSGAAGRLWEERNSPEAMTAAYADLYRSVLEARRSR